MSVAPLSSRLIFIPSRAYRTAFGPMASSARVKPSQLKRSIVGQMAVNGANGVNGTRAKHDLSALKINQSRLLDAIHTGCKFGAAHRYGEYASGFSPSKTCGTDSLTVTQPRRAWQD